MTESAGNNFQSAMSFFKGLESGGTESVKSEDSAKSEGAVETQKSSASQGSYTASVPAEGQGLGAGKTQTVVFQGQKFRQRGSQGALRPIKGRASLPQVTAEGQKQVPKGGNRANSVGVPTLTGKGAPPERPPRPEKQGSTAASGTPPKIPPKPGKQGSTAASGTPPKIPPKPANFKLKIDPKTGKPVVPPKPKGQEDDGSSGQVKGGTPTPPKRDDSLRKKPDEPSGKPKPLPKPDRQRVGGGEKKKADGSGEGESGGVDAGKKPPVADGSRRPTLSKTKRETDLKALVGKGGLQKEQADEVGADRTGQLGSANDAKKDSKSETLTLLHEQCKEFAEALREETADGSKKTYTFKNDSADGVGGGGKLAKDEVSSKTRISSRRGSRVDHKFKKAAKSTEGVTAVQHMLGTLGAAAEKGLTSVTLEDGTTMSISDLVSQVKADPFVQEVAKRNPNEEISKTLDDIPVTLEFNSKYPELSFLGIDTKRAVLSSQALLEKLSSDTVFHDDISNRMNASMQKLLPGAPSAVYTSADMVKTETDPATWKATEQELRDIKEEVKKRVGDDPVAVSNETKIEYGHRHGGAEAGLVYSKAMDQCSKELQSSDKGKTVDKEESYEAIHESYVRLQAAETYLRNVRKQAIAVKLNNSTDQSDVQAYENLDKVFDEIREARVALMASLGIEVKLSDKF